MLTGTWAVTEQDTVIPEAALEHGNGSALT